MRTPLLIASLSLLGGCTTSAQRERDKLADRIEARVKLPLGAARLEDYAHYYGFDQRGFVVGLYAPGYAAPNPSDTCEKVLEDLTTRVVPCAAQTGKDRLRTGERRWVEKSEQLPMIMDGGCSVVTIIYDPKRDVIKDAYCNGVA